MSTLYPPHSRIVYAGEMETNIPTFVIIDGSMVTTFYPTKPTQTMECATYAFVPWKTRKDGAEGPELLEIHEAFKRARTWAAEVRRQVEESEKQLEVPIHEAQDGWSPVDIPGIKNDD